MLSFDVFQFALGITAPIFILLAIGNLLKKKGVLTDEFVTTGSQLVFNITLPALLFVNIVAAKFSLGDSIGLLGLGVIGTIAAYLILELVMPWLVQPATDRGVVIQGAFRANMGIIGLAYCVNAYGSEVYSVAAVYLAMVTIVYNVLSVITLVRWLSPGSSAKQLLTKVFAGVVKNPLIIAICAALLINVSHIRVPEFLLQTGEYFAQVTLPLALLCAGASLNIKRDKNLGNAMISTSLKLMIIPALLVGVGAYLGFSGMELGVLFLMCSAPSASVSYVMARALGGNGVLAANIIAITTVLSVVSTSVGIIILRSLELM